MASSGSIVAGAFRLVKERPAAVFVWSLIYLLASIGFAFAMRPFYRAQLAGADPDPAVAMANFWSDYGPVLLAQLAAMLLFLVVFTATQRAVLRPQESSLAYLRLGMDELRIIGLAIFLVILFYVGAIAVALLMVALTGIVMMAVGTNAGMTVLALVPLLTILVLGVWLQVRFSLAFPLTVLRRRIVIGEAWRVSRGRFWGLFGGYLAIGLMLLLIWIVVAATTAGSYWLELLRSGFDPETWEAASRDQMLRQIAEIDAMTVLGWAVGGLLGGLGIALMGGAVATAARQIAGDQALAREFA